ncbi:MAG: DUF1549 domain-containing protein [Pirellulaceae bacterium]
MTDDREDPLLDAFLEEVLGDVKPPDLSARILHAWSVRSSQRDSRFVEQSANGNGAKGNGAAGNGAAGNGKGHPQPAGQADNAAPPPIAAVSPAARHRASRNGQASRRSRWSRHATALAATAAACLALAGVVIGVVVVQSHRDGDAQPVASPDGKSPAAPKQNPPQDRLANNDGRKPSPESPPDQSPPVQSPRVAPQPPDDEDHRGLAKKEGFGAPVPFGQKDDPPAEAFVQDAPKALRASPRSEVIAFIDTAFKQVWQEFGVEPSPAATDAEWCRRTYLRIAGRIPSVEELNQFVEQTDETKREQLVNRLVASDEFARNWSFQFTNQLIGRSGGMKPGDIVQREELEDYLREAVHDDKPYDELAYELITATGSNRPDDENYNPAVNFLIANQGPRATLATARTSQVFLGKKLQCAQCHHHHSADWAQNKFWEMNAFFRQMQVETNKGAARIVNRDFEGETGEGEADVYYEQINGEVRVAYPAFGPEPVSRSGRLADANLREELAHRITATEDLARTQVNRLWAHFFGYGFTQPVDDMGPHNQPIHPQVLARLSREFAAHDYDLKEVVRWIALSQPFALSSKVQAENTADAPEYGDPPLFARYYTRQMQPEQVYQSLLVAAGAKPGGEAGDQEEARLAWLGQFTRSMGTDEGDETSSFDGAVGQSLVLMNGPLTRRVISKEDGGMLARLSESGLSPQDKVEHLFLAAVARRPNARELRLAESLLESHEQIEALQTIWWALLNSNEFILDH